MAGGQKPNVDHKKGAMLLLMAMEQTPEVCQLWPGTIDRKGYGRVWYGGRWRLAHSAMWEVVNGPLDSELTLDHYRLNDELPCSRACVNLFHLEPVPDVVNTMRGHGICARQARQTACKRGHPFTPGNTAIRNGGGRVCRTCRRERYRRNQVSGSGG